MDRASTRQEAVQARGLSRRPRKVAVVASLTYSLTNFRLELLKALVAAGHEVTAFAPEHDAEVVGTLDTIGVRFEQIPMARTALSPFTDLRTLFVLWRHFRRLKPDVVLPYTMKPIIYGCLAARLAGVPHRFALITGLGSVFADSGSGTRDTLVRSLSVLLYRVALVGTERVFVYNEADRRDAEKRRFIRDPSRIVPVPGSGVDLDHFQRSDPPTEPVTFLLTARLLREKGIVEYVEAARRVRQRFSKARFQLLGPFDSNPSSLSPAEIDAWAAEGAIEYLGETRDVRPYLARCSVFVLPSYYREGIPRTILEAMASGRAVLTADTPGCRDAVVNGENGLVVKPRSADALAEAMTKFIEDPELAKRMGSRSHELVRERFDVRAVNRLLLTEMSLA